MVILNDDGLLRANTGCTSPLPSLTPYTDSAKKISIARKHYSPLLNMHNDMYEYQLGSYLASYLTAF